MMLRTTLLCSALLGLTSAATAQSADADREELQMAAVEALISAPEERAIPLARRVLEGNYSVRLKERALFVLSQIDRPEAREAVLAAARNGGDDLQHEAIRMIGISGDPEALSQLRTIYADGDEDVRDAVLEAYLIIGDAEAVYEIAAGASTEDEFDAALEKLAAMGAREQLRRLRDRADMSEQWIEALMVSDDRETLRQLALDGSNIERQAQAIEALGVLGGDDVEQTLVDIYRSTSADEIRDAALEGMMMAGYDQAVLALYRASDDPAEKKELLEYLVMMDSDAAWDVIDAALGETE